VPRLETLEDRDLPATLFALTLENTLLTFDSSSPASVVSKNITGVLPGESLQDIAVRPATGQLYGLSFGHLYRLDPSTGVASSVGDPNVSLALNGTLLAMSYDPVADRLRVVTAQVVASVTQSERNLTLAPDTSQVVSTGTAPQYATGDVQFGRTPRLGHLAYTNEFSGAKATTLYGIDDLPQRPDRLVTLGGQDGVPTPDQGQVFTVGPTSGWSGFTIGGSENTAFAVSQDDNSLWTLNLANGTAIRVGPSGLAGDVTGLAALVESSPPPPPPPPSNNVPAVSIDDVTVTESVGGAVDATFTVTLSATSSQGVTVQVRTRDGTAVSPQEYQPLALTTLTFSPQQTTQTVTVKVYDNQLMGGVETFFVDLSNPTHATLATAQGRGTIANHPLVLPPANQLLVESLYQDLLGRLPDATGESFLKRLLDAGVPPTAVVQAIISSPEYVLHQVQDLYTRLLGRPADAVGLQGAVAALAGGMPLGQLEAVLLGSPEYLARHGGTLTGFLQGVYAEVLGRPIDPAAAAFWSEVLASGIPPAQVAALIANSAEAVQSLVNARYHHFLRRNVDPATLQFWGQVFPSALNSLLAGMDLTLAVSTEYRNGIIPRRIDREFLEKLSHDLLGHSPDLFDLERWSEELVQGVPREQVAYDILTSDEFRRLVITQGGIPPVFPRIAPTDTRFAFALAVFGNTMLLGGGTLVDEEVNLFLQTDFGNDSTFILDVFRSFQGLQVDLGNPNPLVEAIEADLNSAQPHSYQYLTYLVVIDHHAGAYRASQLFGQFLGSTQIPVADEQVYIPSFGSTDAFSDFYYRFTGAPLPTLPSSPPPPQPTLRSLQTTEEDFLAVLLGTTEYFPRD
jgi:hypothetical protein